MAAPDLARLLRASRGGIRPFTISPLKGHHVDQSDTVELLPGEPCWLRITLLESALHEQLMDLLIPA